MYCAVIGSCKIDKIPPKIWERYVEWLHAGHNAGMKYLENHPEIRQNPELLLPGAKSIISLAFPYASTIKRNPSLPRIAAYALGDDYHDALRSFLLPFIESLHIQYGGEFRLCIDSAPLFERYFAEKSGVGSHCDNGLISSPGFGTQIFLAEILSASAIEIPPSHLSISEVGEWAISPISEDEIREWSCSHCGVCRRACPAGALQADSTVDARRCLSYLTIEHRGDWDEEGSAAMASPAGRSTLFGCDLCQSACQLNKKATQSYIPIPTLRPRSEIISISPSQILDLSQEEFSALFRNSAIKRAKISGLRRNALNAMKKSSS